MKTLKELNSKWYWRLTKVIWSLISLIIGIAVILSSILYLYEIYKSYSPSNLVKVSSEIDGYKRDLDETLSIKNQFEKIEKLGPKLIENVEVKDNDGIVFRAYDTITRKNLKKYKSEIQDITGGEEITLFFLLRALGYSVEGVTIDFDRKDFYISPNDVTLDSYLSGVDITITETYTTSAKEELNEDVTTKEKLLLEAESDFENIKSGNSSVFYFYNSTEKSSQLNELLGSKDYVSSKAWTKLIIYSLLIVIISIIGLFILNYIFSRILYYIILGKFSPDKE